MALDPERMGKSDACIVQFLGIHSTSEFLVHRQWHRNQDANPVAVDQVYVIRNTTQCPNKAGAAPAPGPSAQMASIEAGAPVKSFSLP
jgi:hypothetical protein